MPEKRALQLAAGLAVTRQRLRDACVAASRPISDVTLLPVTKFFPASDVAHLIALGCKDFGENREQEAAAKAAQLGTDVQWHMLGHIQRNKAKSVARWASLVHSVDSVRLASALDAGALAAINDGERPGPLPVLAQLSLDGDTARGGISRSELFPLLGAIDAAPGLSLLGVMAVPPLGSDAEAQFADLAAVFAEVQLDHPHAQVLSAGMSADLEVAVKFGSTLVRVGTAIMGDRPIRSEP